MARPKESSTGLCWLSTGRRGTHFGALFLGWLWCEKLSVLPRCVQPCAGSWNKSKYCWDISASAFPRWLLMESRGDEGAFSCLLPNLEGGSGAWHWLSEELLASYRCQGAHSVREKGLLQASLVWAPAGVVSPRYGFMGSQVLANIHLKKNKFTYWHCLSLVVVTDILLTLTLTVEKWGLCRFFWRDISLVCISI